MTGSMPVRMNTGTRMTVHRMKTTLKSAGDEAGIMNRRSEFSMPMQAAATATSRETAC